jgi:hypothetical protein
MLDAGPPTPGLDPALCLLEIPSDQGPTMSSQPMSSQPIRPLRYEPSFETPEEEESATIAELIETLRKITTTTHEDTGHGYRAVHAKSHGLLTGELQVLDGLPTELAQGLFARPGRYPLVMRFSTVPGDLLDDSVSTPRGLAIKIFGVDGPRLPGSEDDTTQDFVMVNGPAFGAPDAKHFVKNLKLVAATTDKSESLKKAFSAVAQSIEKVSESLGHKSPTLLSLGGHPETHILGETYYSQVPSLHGPYIAKFSIAPVSPTLTALTGAPVDLRDKPNGLRAAVVDYFAQSHGEWELCAQFCTDLASMPIEDASVVWPEDVSPFLPVARIVIPVQVAWNEAREAAIDDGLSFNPWHGLDAHRPLGSIMRARNVVYRAMAMSRFQQNGKTFGEPASLEELSLYPRNP